MIKMKKRIKKVITSLCILLICSLTYLIINIKTGVGIPCLFKLKTGFLCPGCGITRMLGSVVMLDFEKAFYYNRLVFIFLPVILFYVVKSLYLYIRYEKITFSKTDNVLFVFFIILMVAFGIARNII